MSKGAKKILKIVGIAVFVGATLGIGAAVVGGLSIGTAAGLTVGAGLSLASVASIGLGLVAIGSAPTPPSLSRTGANTRGAATADPDALGVYVWGTTTVPSNLVFEQVTGTDKDTISSVFAHAFHRIESYESLSVGGDDGPEAITFSGDDATGDYAGILSWHRKTGAPSQTAITLTGTAWTSTAKFAGVAHSAMVWSFKDQDKISAVPRRFDIVVKGAWLYDPRLDTSAGGDGDQDITDPTTWEFNDGNAVLVLMRYLIGEFNADGDRLWGGGAAAADFDMDNWAAMANIADESIDDSVRFRLGGIYQLDGSLQNFVERWEQETGGKLSKAGGIYRVWLPNDDLTSATTITNDDLLAGYPINHAIASDISNLFNTARGRYIEPTEGYRGFPYPEVSESDAVTDDGKKRVLSQDFSWVQEVAIAQRIARIKVRRSRFQRIWTIPMGWKAQGPDYKPFTVHTLNIKETGGDDQVVRVIDRQMSFNGVTILTLQQEDSSIYSETEDLGDPWASNTIPNRLDRLGATTPRYVDGTAIDDLKPAESDADETSAHGQAASWLTTLVDATGIDADDIEVILDVLNMVNAPDAAGADVTADNGQLPSWLTALIAGTDIDADEVAAVIDALDLINAPAEAGADSTALHSNSLDNPEFEAGDTGWAKGTDWTIVEDGTNARSGSWCAKKSGASGFTGLLNSNRLQVNPGDRVLAQGFGKRTSGSSNISVSINWYNAAGTLLSSDFGNTLTSSSYSQSRVVATAPASAVSAECGFDAGSGTYYGDGAYMSVIPKDADIDALNTTNGPAEADADETSANGQPPSWLTALIASGDIDSSDIEEVMDVLNMVNGPAAAGADVTGDNTAADTKSEIDSFTVTGTNGWFGIEPSGTCEYTRTGNGQVTLRFPAAIIGTSNAVSCAFDGIPSALRPATQQRLVVYPLVDNGGAAQYFGTVTVATTGDFTFSLMKPDGTYATEKGFTSSSTKGVGAGLQFTYTI